MIKINLLPNIWRAISLSLNTESAREATDGQNHANTIKYLDEWLHKRGTRKAPQYQQQLQKSKNQAKQMSTSKVWLHIKCHYTNVTVAPNYTQNCKSTGSDCSSLQ